MPKQKSKVITKRIIYDKNYYKAQTMLRDFWFIKKINWLKQRFTEVGCPIPQNGFKKYKDYLAWNELFWKKYSNMQNSSEFLTGCNKITSGKRTINLQEFNDLERFKEQFLPPLYGSHFGDILERFHVDRNDRKFRNFLEFYLFLRKNEYPTSLFTIKWIRNRKTDQMDLFVQIHGCTRKEDLINNWRSIANEQKYLPDFLGKNKEWKMFERDIQVYELYKKIKGTSNRKREEIWAKSKDMQIFCELHGKYPKLTIRSIRTIIARTKKRLGEI